MSRLWVFIGQYYTVSSVSVPTKETIKIYG